MPKRRKSYRWLWGIIFLVLIAGTVVIAIMVRNNLFGDNASNKTEPTNSSNTVNPDQPKDDTKKEEDKKPDDNTSEKKDVPQYTGDNPNKSDVLSGVVSYADVSGDDLIIRVNIDQFLSEGNCIINVVKNGSVAFTQTVGIMESVSTSTCDGYRIPTSTLPKGDLQLEVLVQSGNRSGKITGRVRI